MCEHYPLSPSISKNFRLHSLPCGAAKKGGGESEESEPQRLRKITFPAHVMYESYIISGKSKKVRTTSIKEECRRHS